MARRRWPGLAPDVIRDIAGRLDHAADFVRFHAVCKPWRESLDAEPPLFQTKKGQFMPWLLAAADKDSTPLIRFRCVFSNSSYRACRPPPPLATLGNWVCSADGTAVRYLTVEQHRPSLQDFLTGEVTQMPPFPRYFDRHSYWDEDNLHGMVYEWKLVGRTHENAGRHGEFCSTYHGGRILVGVGASLCRVITPDVGPRGDLLVSRPCDGYLGQDSYVLESRGRLLWASVNYQFVHNEGFKLGLTRALSVWVHTLEEEASTPDKFRWVRNDGGSLADRVLFLGSPSSFAVDASPLGVGRGCAYFVYDTLVPKGHFGVFRYNFVHGKTELVECLPPRWERGKCTWFVPQPAIAPIQEIAKRLSKAQ
uniref:KIB1-4 beta-propeller domain-containing protein n=1 Tax=Aegilops tauschii TaxID=37682 RepID=M8C644_AEGTA